MQFVLLNGSQEDRKSNLKKAFGSLRNQKVCRLRGLHNYKDKEHLFRPFVSQFNPSEQFNKILHDVYEDVYGVPMQATKVPTEKATVPKAPEKTNAQDADKEDSESKTIEKGEKVDIDEQDRDDLEDWSADDYDVVYPYDEQFEHEMYAEDDWVDDEDIAAAMKAQNNLGPGSDDENGHDNDKAEKADKNGHDEEDEEANKPNERRKQSVEKSAPKFSFGDEDDAEEEEKKKRDNDEEEDADAEENGDDNDNDNDDDDDDDGEKRKRNKKKDNEDKDLKFVFDNDDGDGNKGTEQETDERNHARKSKRKGPCQGAEKKKVQSEETNDKHINELNAYQILKEIEVEIIYFVHKYMNMEKKQKSTQPANGTHPRDGDKPNGASEPVDKILAMSWDANVCELVESKTLEQMEQEKQKAKQEEMLRINEKTTEMLRLPRIMRHGHTHKHEQDNHGNNVATDAYCSSSEGEGSHSDRDWDESDDMDSWLPENMKNKHGLKQKKELLRMKQKHRSRDKQHWRRNRATAKELIENIIYSNSDSEGKLHFENGEDGIDHDDDNHSNASEHDDEDHADHKHDAQNKLKLEQQIVDNENTRTFFMKVAIGEGADECVHVRVFWDGYLAQLQNIVFNKSRTDRLKKMKNLFRNRTMAQHL
ncbi:hypothetical protein RFI_30487 [Reticulomyxa filosa]|uniref:Uncharacterized protein n=1 Tax=Reticulomyxa filosa TaxID=46433 RepID=X6LZ84_RETFI|nr:hypothetical protein RFI_30487 [Reticulomyxa filosa]|eukprot:ETO06904.1 hypothetical protein RFI_30487 [Reticulomyxa filosa]